MCTGAWPCSALYVRTRTLEPWTYVGWVCCESSFCAIWSAALLQRSGPFAEGPETTCWGRWKKRITLCVKSGWCKSVREVISSSGCNTTDYNSFLDGRIMYVVYDLMRWSLNASFDQKWIQARLYSWRKESEKHWTWCRLKLWWGAWSYLHLTVKSCWPSSPVFKVWVRLITHNSSAVIHLFPLRTSPDYFYFYSLKIPVANCLDTTFLSWMW